MNVNRSQFWQLLEGEHPRARAYSIRLTGNAEEGDDLYQDAVLKAYIGFAELRRHESFRPWLYSIINNAYRGRFNSPWWQRLLFGAIDLEQIAGSTDPEPVYDARRRLESALAALSADDRIIVTMVELDGWKITELAALLGKTEGFIKMRLSRARTKMRNRLVRLNRTADVGNGGMEELCCATKPEED